MSSKSSSAASDYPWLLIVGASARSAAQCAVRAGFHVWAADLYADRDLIECAHALPFHGFLDRDDTWWRHWHGVPLLLCGGTENQPELVETLIHHGLLCGLKQGSLPELRSPSQWGRWALASGIQWPESIDGRQDMPSQLEPEDWLLKSSTGAGGLSVQVWGKGAITQGNYLQRRLEGDVLGVTFLSCRNRSMIVGCAQSWQADRFPGPTPFAYRGSFGPVELNDADSRCLDRFAEVVHASTGILGLWQADFIKNGDGLWLLEINPRWSSSMELFDTLASVRLVAHHVQAIVEGCPVVMPAKPHPCIGKVIRYATSDIQPTAEQLQYWWSKRWSGSVDELHLENRLADIPNTTDKIPTGYPIYTEFASGESMEEVESRLECSIHERSGGETRRF